jgi:4-hydroxy-3-polyprenylbenzoate decarboxylase
MAMMESANRVSRAGTLRPRRLVIGITGGAGAAYGVRLLEVLQATDVETHLVMCDCSKQALLAETGRTPAAVRRLADRAYQPSNQAARISSGSFLTDGMIIAPCSTRSLAAIANGLATNLVHRAADVMMKEGRKVVLLVQESPLSSIQVENLERLARVPVVVVPSLAEHSAAGTLVEDLDLIVARLLGHFDISLPLQ